MFSPVPNVVLGLIWTAAWGRGGGSATETATFMRPCWTPSGFCCFNCAFNFQGGNKTKHRWTFDSSTSTMSFHWDSFGMTLGHGQGYTGTRISSALCWRFAGSFFWMDKTVIWQWFCWFWLSDTITQKIPVQRNARTCGARTHSNLFRYGSDDEALQLWKYLWQIWTH